MGSFGQRLQRECEMRGITLDEIAISTKIGTRSLRALEEEDFDQLPGGIFNKGFVRSYARYLGIDEEQAVADYLSAAGNTQPAESSSDAVLAQGPPQRSLFAPVTIALAIAVLALGGWKYLHQSNSANAAPPPSSRVAHAPAANVATTPAPTTTADTKAQAPATQAA